MPKSSKASEAALATLISLNNHCNDAMHAALIVGCPHEPQICGHLLYRSSRPVRLIAGNNSCIDHELLDLFLFENFVLLCIKKQQQQQQRNEEKTTTIEVFKKDKNKKKKNKKQQRNCSFSSSGSCSSSSASASQNLNAYSSPIESYSYVFKEAIQVS